MAIQGMDVSNKKNLIPKERMSCGCLKSFGFLEAFLAIEVGRSFLWGSRIPRVDRMGFQIDGSSLIFHEEKVCCVVGGIPSYFFAWLWSSLNFYSLYQRRRIISSLLLCVIVTSRSLYISISV